MTPSVAVQYSLRPTISVRGEVRPVQRQPRCGLRHVFAWARALVMLGCLELGRSDRSGNGSEACLHAWARDNVTSKTLVVLHVQLINRLGAACPFGDSESLASIRVCPSLTVCRSCLATQPIRSTACRTRLTNPTALHCRPACTVPCGCLRRSSCPGRSAAVPLLSPSDSGIA